MRVAFLGPAGTHSERSLKEFLPQATGVPCFSISDIFRSLCEEESDAAFLPIENMIQGPVTETLDLLFEHHATVEITESYLGRIENAFAVASDSLCKQPWPRPITRILSHDQPLRQCAKYLATAHKSAERVAVASTAQGIAELQRSAAPDVAVIASPATLSHPDFRIIAHDVSDIPGNKTRFLLVERKGTKKKRKFIAASSWVTSIVLDPGRDRQGLLFEILQVLSVQHGVNLVTIHSRPDTRGGVIFYFDLEGKEDDPRIAAALTELRRFCSESTAKTAQIHTLGSYPREAFYTLPFKSIAIVGSEGAMGAWFKNFFSQVGIPTFDCDKNSGASLQEVAKKADVILLSVPMSAAAEVANELIPHLRTGQLVVENCSVKSCILPLLVERVNPGTELLGIHTMFGADITSLVDQNIIVTRTEQSGVQAQAFEDVLYKYGANVHHRSVEEHDMTGAFVQSTLQLALLILADVMRRSFSAPEDLEFMSTPNFRSTRQSLNRVLRQSPELLLDLQTQNVFAGKMRHRFLESAFRLVFALDQNDEKTFREIAASALAFSEGKDK